MEAQELFKNLIERGRLSHAYVLWGYGAARERVAVAEAVAEMLEPRPFLDCMSIVPVDGTIGIPAMREASRFLWRRPVRSLRTTLIVHDVHALTPEAQNALLKIVEEPPAHGLILFTVRDYGLLVPALQSRMQKIYMPSPRTMHSDKRKISEEIETFLMAGAKERKDMIKKLMECDEAAFASFVEGLMAALAQNPLRHYRALHELSRRWMLMNQFQTNRKLQLEAVISLL